jgi:DNA-binding LacI/PurR family transcriptional regulator
LANIKDVARLANVSISTVSNVINRSKNVNEELKQRVYEAIKELDYKTNSVARSLKSRKTGVIGVILPIITSNFFPQVLKGIEDEAQKHGYQLMFFDCNYEFEKEQKFIQLSQNYWVEGIILDSCVNLSVHASYVDFLIQKIIKEMKIPIVLLEQTPQKQQISSVMVDNQEGGYIATKHLLDNEHRQIAHIIGPPNLPMSFERLNGYRRALTDNHLPFNESLVKQGDFSPLSGYNAMKELLMEGRKCSAFFAGNDQMAIGAMKAVKEAGLRVPEDIAAVGFDNISGASLVSPALTTVNVPKYRMGARAVEILVENINNPEIPPRLEIVPTNFIIRTSTVLCADGTWDLYGW